MANENILRGIFQVGVDAAELNAGLDNVVRKYKATSAQTDEQVKKIQELTNEEARLTKARDKSNNPTSVVLYNNKINAINKQIQQLTTDTKKLNTSQKELDSTTNKLINDLKTAFQTTGMIGFKAKLREINDEFKSVSGGAKAFLKETVDGLGKTTNEFSKLKTELKLAKSELAAAFSSGNQKAIEAAAKKVGDLKDQMDDLNEAGKIFAAGDKFEQIGTALGSITGKLASLDFSGANSQAKLLLSITKSMTFAEASKGIADLGSTLLNVGKALLLNPLFLIGAAIVGIVSNFDELKKSGGALGATMRFLDDVMTGAKRAFDDLTDAANLTNNALERALKNQIKLITRANELQQQASNVQIAIRKAQGRNTDKLEQERLRSQADFAALEIANIKKQNALKGIEAKKFSQEDKDRIKELSKIVVESETGVASSIISAWTAARNALRDLAKDIKGEADRSKAFDVEFKLKPLSKQQIQAQFQLQRNEVARNRQEEINAAALEFEGEARKGEIIAKIKQKYGLQYTLLKKQEAKAIIDAEKELALRQFEIIKDADDKRREKDSTKLEAAKNQQDKLEAIYEASILDEALLESQKAQNKLQITESYYNDQIKLAEKNLQADKLLAAQNIKILQDDIDKRKAAKLDTTLQEQELTQLKKDQNAEIAKAESDLARFQIDKKAEVAVATRNINEQILAEEQALIDSRFERTDAALELDNARNSTRLKNQLDFERSRLALLKNSGKEYTEEYRDQLDKVNLLEKESIKQRRLENIGYFETLANAAIDATNKILDAKIKEIDALTSLQEKRVADAREIASQGNAQMLELEQKRLDDLNKQKEQYVRQQQALATLELIANTAIMISKAAAEGGAGAAFTIGAALIALFAGLLAARQAAGTAAFYKGGEYGYTGDGVATQESHKLGAKPYVYHKREFIFDHENTDKYRDIFHRIHRGQIDLREWQNKAELFDKMKGGINTMNPIIIKTTAGVDGARLDNVEKLLSQLIAVTESKDPGSFHLDKDGLFFGIKRFGERRKLIDKLAR